MTSEQLIEYLRYLVALGGTVIFILALVVIIFSLVSLFVNKYL